MTHAGRFLTLLNSKWILFCWQHTFLLSQPIPSFPFLSSSRQRLSSFVSSLQSTSSPLSCSSVSPLSLYPQLQVLYYSRMQWCPNGQTAVCANKPSHCSVGLAGKWDAPVSVFQREGVMTLRRGTVQRAAVRQRGLRTRHSCHRAKVRSTGVYLQWQEMCMLSSLPAPTCHSQQLGPCQHCRDGSTDRVCLFPHCCPSAPPRSGSFILLTPYLVAWFTHLNLQGQSESVKLNPALESAMQWSTELIWPRMTTLHCKWLILTHYGKSPYVLTEMETVERLTISFWPWRKFCRLWKRKKRCSY